MAKITKDTIMGDLLKRDINSAKILMDAGMHCVGCPASAGESLEEACQVHGIDVNDLVGKLNEFFGE
ncbi:MAG: DUF1858 domain-containing protein [Eubacteriales bacterium]